MMNKNQAGQFLSSLVNDYCDQLRRQGHKQTAELVKANGQAAVASLVQAESGTSVPDAGPSD